MVPEDRRAQGLMMHMPALENATLAVVSRMQRFGFVQRRAERMSGEQALARVGFQQRALELPASALSGGNQQKTLIARWLLADPDLLLLDDPARGIDVGAKEDVYRMIQETASKGKGIILTSSELPELIRCSDRILVLAGGRVTGLFHGADATQERIMAAATLSGGGTVQ
jgi:ABC-type sugar transport system ATPase subunit